MAIQYRGSDLSWRVGRRCAACAEVQVDIVRGEMRLLSAFSRLPSRADWPLLGCMYRSKDTGSGPFGYSRTASGLLGMKVLGASNTSDVKVVNELGYAIYYLYMDGQYRNTSSSRAELYGTASGGWLEERPSGPYFEYDSNGRLTKGYDPQGNALYFEYDGSGDHQSVECYETGLAVYFQTDGSGRITSIKDWGGRETTISYDGSGNLEKVVGPSLCVTYFDYDATSDLVAMTDSEGRTIYYTYDSSHRLTAEAYDGAATYYDYEPPLKGELDAGAYQSGALDLGAAERV